MRDAKRYISGRGGILEFFPLEGNAFQLGGFARINGDLFYGPTGTFNNNVQAGWTSVTGQVTQLPAKRVFPPIPNFSVGTTDPPIQKGVSTPIGAGSYRDITVPRDTNITLTGGTYYIDHFTLNQGATISLQGANTTLFVKSGLTFNQGAVLNSSDPSLFQIYYAGTTTATVSLKPLGSFYGTIYAPNATLSLQGGSDFCSLAPAIRRPPPSSARQRAR